MNYRVYAIGFKRMWSSDVGSWEEAEKAAKRLVQTLGFSKGVVAIINEDESETDVYEAWLTDHSFLTDWRPPEEP
jgi:hypothetical protein